MRTGIEKIFALENPPCPPLIKGGSPSDGGFITHLLYIFIFIFFTPLFLLSQPQLAWVNSYSSNYGTGMWVGAMINDTLGNVYVGGAIGTGGSENENFLTIKYSSSGIQEWIATYNGSGSNSIDEIRAICLDKFGNVYVTGISEQNGLFSNAYCTIKYNSSGIQQWVARFKNSPYLEDNPSAISVDDSGNVYVTGTSQYPLYGSNNITSDIVTIKYKSSNGDSIWVKKLNGGIYQPYFSYYNYGNSLQLDNNNNIYVVGSVYTGTTPANYACLLKYNVNGTLLWSSIYNITYSENINLTVDTIHNCIFTVGKLVTAVGGPYYLTIKLNSTNGLQQWASIYSGDNFSNYPTCIKNDLQGNVYVSGYGFFSNNSPPKFVTIKYDFISGDSDWVASTSGKAYSLDVDKYSNIYVTGFLNIDTSYSLKTIKYNSSGIQQWLISYYGGGLAIHVDNNENIYVSGFYNSGVDKRDIRTLKYYQPDGIKQISNEISKKFELSQNYPNPFNPSTTIEFALPKTSYTKLIVYDLLGKEIETLVNEELKAGSYKVDFNGSNFSSGVYFYKLIVDNASSPLSITRKMVVVK